jgi:hypothetical protein
MRSDLAIASEDAAFALDEVKLGIPPMFVMAAIVDHMAPKRALDVILTSREFSAKEALDVGLLSRVVPASELDVSVEKLLGELRARDREVLRVCKCYLRAVDKMPLEAPPARLDARHRHEDLAYAGHPEQERKIADGETGLVARRRSRLPSPARSPLRSKGRRSLAYSPASRSTRISGIEYPKQWSGKADRERHSTCSSRRRWCGRTDGCCDLRATRRGGCAD